MRLFKYLNWRNALYLATITFLFLTPLLWFWRKGDVLVNGVDTNFPLDPNIWFIKRLFVWNSAVNTGGDFSSSTAGLFFHLIQVIPYLLGFNLQVVQILSLVFWFMLIILSALILSRLIFKNLLVQIMFVVFYSFNIYLFNTWENVKVANLSLVAGIPIFISILILMRERKIGFTKAGVLSIILGVIVSGTGINPAYYTSLFLISSIFLIGNVLISENLNEILSRIKEFVWVVLFVVLVNSFWILPTINYIISDIDPLNSIDKIGFTNWVDSLSENTSILNILRAQGAWDWYAFDSLTGLPLYIPYALNYFHRIPFLLFSFLVPSIALLSLIFRQKYSRHLYIGFGLMLIIGVFLGVGTHLPTGSFYSFLYYNLPFFTLFRSPWYIFTPMVILAIAGLICLLFDNLFQKNLQKPIRISVTALALIMIFSNLIYNYPLIQGKIFRPGRLDSFYINFPDYIFEAGKWLVNTPSDRIVSYPEDEIEQFEWGYRGIESILGLLTDKEMIFSSLNAPDSASGKLTKEFYSNLRKGQIESAYKLISKMNIEYIFEKKDQKSISLDLSGEITKLEKKSFNKWNFYKVPDDKRLPKIFVADKTYLSESTEVLPIALTAIDKNDIIMNSQDNVLKKASDLTSSSGSVILATNNQSEDFYNFYNSPSRLSNRLLKRNLSKVEYKIKMPISSNYQLMLERYKIEDYGLPTSGILKVIIDNQEIDLSIEKTDNSFVYFKPIEISDGTHKLEMNLINPNLVSLGNFDDIGNFETKGIGQVRQIKDLENTYIEMINKGETDFNLTYTLPQFDPITPYLITLKYKQIYGNNAQLLMGQSNDTTLIKIQNERLPNHPEWQTVSMYYNPVKTNSKMSVNIVSPEIKKDPLGTTILYDDLGIFRTFTNNLIAVRTNDQSIISSPKSTYDRKSPIHYDIKVENVNSPHVLVFSENYSPNWKAQIKSEGGEDVKIKPLHFTANLYSNAWYIEGAPSSYKVTLYYEPQNFYLIGIIISFSTPLFLIFSSRIFPLIELLKKIYTQNYKQRQHQIIRSRMRVKSSTVITRIIK